MAEDGNGSKIKAAEFRGMMIERTEIILRELSTLKTTVEDHTKNIERLKVTASFWGFLAGAVPALATALIMLLR
jgi:hypothetical protein